MEIVKPWGKEEILEKNERYMFKRLTMLKGHRCSLQFHNQKHETIYVLEGKLRILIGDGADDLEAITYGPNEFVAIEQKKVHRMEAVEDSVYLEASTPEMYDVERMSDDYMRD